MRIVIADDEVLVRDGLARLLEDAGVEVVSRCMDAATLLRTVDSWQPDVAIALLGLLSASQLTREGPSRSGGPCTLDRTSPSHPRAKVAVVESASEFPKRLGVGMIAREMADEELEPYLRPWLGAGGQAADYRQVAQFDERYTREIERRYGEIDIPTLVVWGEDDAWLDPGFGQRLADAIRGARLEFAPNAGHFLQRTRRTRSPRRSASSSQPSPSPILGRGLGAPFELRRRVGNDAIDLDALGTTPSKPPRHSPSG